MKFVTVFLIAVLVSIVQGSPTGAPALACSDMIPQHGVPPQASANPYTLSVTHDGATFSVTVEKADAAATDFKGLFIQARRTGSTEPLGTFLDPLPEETQFRPCPTDASENNGVTHTINTLKSSKSFFWLPPAGDLNGVHFVATVVQDTLTFWTGLESEDLGAIPY